MKYATWVALVFGSFCCSSYAVLGQTASAIAQLQPAPPATPTITCRASFGPSLAMSVPGSSAPYSAVQESSNVQTLADGTHISHKPLSLKIYRDSQGRTRSERSFCQAPGGTSDGMIIEIRDPVSGYSYVLDDQNHVAHRFALQVKHPTTAPAPLAGSIASETVQRTATPNQDSSKPSNFKESLGSQTMEGIIVEGTRTTEIIPEGFEDNDRPITVVRERWFSAELGITLLRKDNDPRNGESITRITNIDLSNPLLALFQPPADYKIVDETERIILTFTRP